MEGPCWTKQKCVYLISSCGTHKIRTGLVFWVAKATIQKVKSWLPCNDLVQVVQPSAEVNEAQLVATRDGHILVPTYDWASFFNDRYNQTGLKGIKKWHHLRFNRSHPGVAFVRTSSDEEEKEINFLSDKNWRPSLSDLRPIISPPGLSWERQIYLYEKIREFCRDEVQDIMCPKPSDYDESEGLAKIETEDNEHSEPSSTTKQRKRRLCSECHLPGHNKRSCPLLK